VSSRALRVGLAWTVVLVACAVIVVRADYTGDLSAFLPRSPALAQQVLVEQLRDGPVSRLLLAGIDGGSVEARALTSRRFAAALRGDDAFTAVSNGEAQATAADQAFLWRNRYLLSSAVDAAAFSAAGLRASLQESLDLLSSPLGLVLQRAFPNDPTGEIVRLAEAQAMQSQPRVREGVWFAVDGERALLLLQTRAAGFDLEGQTAALERARTAFAAVQGPGQSMVLSGPAVFATESRDAIKRDSTRISILATALVAALLLLVFRSPVVLVLGLLPVASGALAGIAAVSAGFGEVYGITLGFGVTLIGEGVDYAIYMFTQTAPGTTPEKSLERIWPTLRLGVATSVCGFAALLLSGFPGLAQLGLFSIAGLLVAVLFTRSALPLMLPAGFSVRIAPALGAAIGRALRVAPKLRLVVPVAVLGAAAVMLAHRGAFWSDDLASLSPVSAAAQALDQQLRRDLGAPDVRYLIVIKADTEDAALAASAQAATTLAVLRDRGTIAGYDAPSDILPSRAVQQARQSALPETDVLRNRVLEAVRGLPVRAETLAPFVGDVAAARVQPLVGRADLAGTHLALKLDSLLREHAGRWTALLLLRGVRDADTVERALPGDAILVDLKRESDRLYQQYRDTALALALAGAAAIVALLGAALRSWRRVLAVILPLAAAVTVTVALLLVLRPSLTIFHLVGLLLVVAVGSNYSLFFDRLSVTEADLSRTVASLLLANLATVIGFGLLGLSSTPVLHAIGSTVAIGALLSLVFSAMLGAPPAQGGAVPA